MKRFILLLSVVSLVFSSFSQSVESGNESEDISWKNTFPRHEIQLGFGDPLYAYMVNPTQNVFYVNFETDMDYWFSDKQSPSPIYLVTSTHALSYKYRACKWLWVGGTVTYTAFASFDLVNDMRRSIHYITIAPEVRFSYLNKRIVTLYSGFNLGIGIKCGEITDFAPVGLTGHINLFGVEVGTRWFGFFELGFGNKGVVSSGIGYHFNNKK